MSSSVPAINFIDDAPALVALLSLLLTPPINPTSQPTIFLDLEGNNLSRNGTVSILTLHHAPTSTTHLIDIYNLSHSAFTTPASPPYTDQTLKSILEDPSIPKVFFDVRNDSDALFSHYRISLQGIIDLQLLELGSRSGGLNQKRLVSGLARCIQYDAKLSFQEKRTWEAVKKIGVEMFAPEKGGSYAVFDKRPLAEEIKKYCAQDVSFLPALLEVYTSRLGTSVVWKGKIEKETLERVRESQSAGYQPHGRQKALGPW
ncbi:hypothetical protein EG329_007520 [Mollisiaceae sp. DMI_Dod_QoI]|nr:hypothetical protein EG329_007520 [Helotiales sp. DMI_Dod_QoI]